MISSEKTLSLFSQSNIANFIESSFKAVGMPNRHAKIVGHLMSEADVSGADGHGVFRLPGYIRRI